MEVILDELSLIFTLLDFFFQTKKQYILFIAFYHKPPLKILKVSKKNPTIFPLPMTLTPTTTSS